PACVYHVSWPVAGSAADLVGAEAALRAQLDAMSLRLQSMFETASDLISSGDVDQVLARIADRAAIEVRAPRHLLAVRLTAEGRLHLHHKGFAAEEARVCAEALEAYAIEDLPSSWLVVPVASNRRDYGRLLATHESGGAFFPQERELLQVYARYAASALDGAAALREAERRYSQSSALLELARELAAAGTSAEIAGRLVDAVGLVVDCDRVGVYLWDPASRRLNRQACAPFDPAVDSPTASWAPDPGGMVERLLRDPNGDPILVDPHSGTIGQLFADAGFVATLMVPLAIPGRLLGLLAVSVRERSERLRLTDDLLDRLSGVAAQATTALQNGRLVDVITHHALHDQLTGLANRRRLTAELRAAVDRARGDGERGALVYVDLDDFKPVNDDLGHDAGDELLVTVAKRLAGCTRATDLVARIGGDEFAILLADASDGEIERVCERIMDAFREPFGVGGRRVSLGVSVGRSCYPADAQDPDGLLRRADRAMFADKRAHKRTRRVARSPGG
ncbi:MAG: diguanylate cyclase domain-containing protein, partial [Solirubrobacteraceae bacterium]